ncbi:MAG TPA: CPBP family intramembrane glutamic endopeptidase [Allosphingosinicella sp.]|jgi:membrane protease YdiL (CAAX protease family)
MIPGLLDHVFVGAAIVLIFPLGGWWAYRRFLARLDRDGEAALVREYKLTLLWLLGLGAGAMLVWLAQGRPLAALGFAPPGGPDAFFAVMMAVAASAGLVARPLLAALSARAAAALRKQLGALAAFLPKTKEQLGWGLLVSLAAGLFEEIAYRGYLIAYFQHWLSDWGAIAASAALFGLAHIYQGKAGVATTALLGGLLGFLYVATGSLLVPVLLHAAVDVSAMVSAWIVLRNAPAPLDSGETRA